VTYFIFDGARPRFNAPVVEPKKRARRVFVFRASPLEGTAMCDQAYLNLLREKVRQREAEENRVAAFGTTPSARFVPWTPPIQSLSDVSDRADAATNSGRRPE
jgi:hypothetical protein